MPGRGAQALLSIGTSLRVTPLCTVVSWDIVFNGRAHVGEAFPFSGLTCSCSFSELVSALCMDK